MSAELSALQTIGELSAAYGLVALGVLLTYAVIEYYDLSTDGVFVLGAAVAARLLSSNMEPLFAVAAAVSAGALVGVITTVIHFRFRIDGLLVGFLMLAALYSIDLRIMKSSNVSLHDVPHLFTATTVPPWVILSGTTVLASVGVLILLASGLGGAARAYRRNRDFVEGLGTPSWLVVGCAVVGGDVLIALSGALVAQSQGFADLQMGDGVFISSIAAIILGSLIFRRRSPVHLVLAALVGAAAYQAVLFCGLRLHVKATDFKLATAIVILASIAVQRLGVSSQIRRWRQRGRR